MKKLLIANRGEIACRVIRTARRMGILTVAVHSEADAGALHVALADEAVAIGPAPARESYLVADRIITAAQATGADAIHPGYGFLSENADFADAVARAGLTFVGPPAEAIRAMGLKDSAKAIIRAAGIPVVPGYMGEDQSLARLERMAASVGYPLLVKAVAGGGGKGMRPVPAPADLMDALLAAKREAAAAFGNDAVMLEKLIQRPRHVEVQIFGDHHGNIVHLFERDCSLQRRHQKLIEEAPAPGLSDRLRHILGIAAVTAGTAIRYANAGTIEFILDMDDRDEEGDPRFYFMEMNTRLQVEHPVTEAITGLDLVEWQLRVARGDMLPLMQDAIEAKGWAMEARLCAENPDAGFLPATGTLERLDFPEGARIETGVRAGDTVSIHYDSMVAKIITAGATREEARRRLVDALDQTVVEGVTTNRGFLARLAAHPAFAAGDVHTGFIPAHETALFAASPIPSTHLAAAARTLVPPPGPSPFARPFRLNLAGATSLALYEADGTAHALTVNPAEVADAACTIVRLDDETIDVRSRGYSWRLFTVSPRWSGAAPEGVSDGSITAPMPGKLLSLHVREGDSVSAGDRLLVLEAMKMEHRMTAPFDGRVDSVPVAAGQQVAEGTLLIRLVPA